MTVTDVGTKTMIRLEQVSKTYPGTEIPAVDSLSLDIPEGEILVLVGPSGCGKSTTLRLINRMIEPSSGRIFFDGDDVTHVNADELRRRIGYVIQQIGLFPHRNITDNIGTVPKLLGWNKSDIAKRADELLALVGLEPSQFRDRYPRELSGGQAQRVGVARALGADPAVLLMDEPFGAIDPITRERLQNEFLGVQETLRKTIVFVTHDIDEAIKMGDRIAILKERSEIAQYDTPERILAAPASEFVTDFIGSGSTLKGLTFERVRDIQFGDYPVVTTTSGRAAALDTLASSGEKWLLVVDEKQHPVRWVLAEHLDRSDKPLVELGQPVLVTVRPQATLRDALEEMLQSSCGHVPVVNEDNKFMGVIAIETLIDVIQRMRREAREHLDAAKAGAVVGV